MILSKGLKHVTQNSSSVNLWEVKFGGSWIFLYTQSFLEVFLPPLLKQRGLPTRHNPQITQISLLPGRPLSWVMDTRSLQPSVYCGEPTTAVWPAWHTAPTPINNMVSAPLHPDF